MKWFLGVLLCVAAMSSVSGLPFPLEKKNAWALIVAGSNGWINYRHQADVCHAYHVLLNQGFPADRIITMMYNDIAYNSENPHPGVIINEPNGTNVYAGVKIDYQKGEVTPKHFLNILKGDKKAMEGIGTGRVIESDHATNIFVYFADHGGPGLLGFPSQLLTAGELESTIWEMRKKQKYEKMFVYIEACDAGSMFNNVLRENINVYAMTASARDESSWGIYCGGSTCLADEFSIRWLNRMDVEPVGEVETFFYLYERVRSEVKKSHVSIYGDLKLGANGLIPRKYNGSAVSLPQVHKQQTKPSSYDHYVNSRDVALHYFQQKAKNYKNAVEKRKAEADLENLIRGRKAVDAVFDDLVVEAAAGDSELETVINEERLLINRHIFPCYTKLIENFNAHCFGHKNEYLMQHYYKLANMCLMGVKTEELIEKMPKICSSYKKMVKTLVL